MQKAYKTIIIALLSMMITLMLNKNVQAHSCYPKIITFSVSNANYDPQNSGHTTTDIFYIIRNKGSGYCYNLKVSFCTNKASQLNGLEKLQYSVNSSSGTNVLNTGFVTGCPYHSSNLTSYAIQGLNLPPGGSTSSSNNFEIFIPSLQFLAAGEYSGDTLQMAIYSKYGQRLDSSSETPSTNIAASCFLPSLPILSSSINTTYTPTGGLSGGAVSFNQAIDKNTAKLKQSSIELSFSEARCNYRANLSIKSMNGGMINNNNLQQVSSFLNKINYIATASFCGVSTQINTDSTSFPNASKLCSISGVNQSDLILTIETSQGNTPLLAGTYEDTLVIKIGSPL